MATGGTIPSGRKQYVYFYNTHGVIEKDKQMYFAPRFNEDYDGEYVSEAFLEIFEEVCPPSSAYSGIEISTWSPQDRTIVVKGNIDDFRLITDEGACLNYFLVKREVTKGEGQQASTSTYYYAFFITGVEQIGGSSVRITAEPDDFTNVFYLHNTHVLTNAEALSGSYEPFNERMKNCYVNRQHYDRVELSEPYYILKVHLTHVEAGLSLVVGTQISIEFETLDPITITGELVYFEDQDYDRGELYLEIKTDEEEEIGNEENWSHIYYDGGSYECQYNSPSNIHWQEKRDLLPANQKIFLNQEESFKFKYQFKDKRLPFSDSEIINFSEEELNDLRTLQPAQISSSLRKKYCLACIKYLVIQFKSSDVFAPLIQAQTRQGTFVKNGLYYKGGGNLEEKFYSQIKMSTPIVYIPFIQRPKLLSDVTLNTPSLNILLQSSIGGSSLSKSISASDNMRRIMQKLFSAKNYGDYIASAYISPISPVGLSFSIVASGLNPAVSTVTMSTGYPITNETGSDVTKYYLAEYYNNQERCVVTSIQQWPADIGKDWSSETLSQSLSLDEHALIFDFDNNEVYNFDYIAFMPRGYDGLSNKIRLYEKTRPNLKSSYYDPVLETEPYSFYTLSFLSNEIAFPKNRYYKGGDYSDINIKSFISVNGMLKVSIIPYYDVEQNDYAYYNESLSFILQNPLTFVSDAFSSYYYQNMAQMKNQFAVNDYNRGIDLGQHFFNSGPNAVGQSAFRRAWVGAVSETINQFSQMADEAVDWVQSKHVIEMNQKAKLADMGRSPDIVKQSGSEIYSDILSGEYDFIINHYSIDKLSHDSIAKFLERFGYQVNLYDNLNTIDRVGWNFVKLNSFDWNPASQYDIMIEQEDSIKKIFLQGVTLLHDTYYLTAGHNYEAILDY